MQVDKMWLKEGQLLGLRMLFNGKPDTAYYRVNAREWADYSYTFPGGAVAANTATGYLDLQDAANTYILQPRYDYVIYHFFIGISRSNSILFLNYPQQKDRNALTGTRLVSAVAMGGLWGYDSPLLEPNPKSELFTLRDLRPTLNMFNAHPATAQVLQIRLYAYMYSVDGPFWLGDPEVGDANHVRQLEEDSKARLYSIYGIEPANAPTQVQIRYDQRQPAAAAYSGFSRR
jgi:hypothetical protein